MDRWFSVDHLDVERLLAEWRWLCPHQMTLVARNGFGDLFLRTEEDSVLWLAVATGKLTKIADSETDFRQRAKTTDDRRQWFAEQDFQSCTNRGLNPSTSECIGFPIPLVFAEADSSNTPYIVDVYECVSFLGDLNRQISSLPDGSKVRLRVQPPKPAPSR
jgi:hypothetical protein